MSAAFLLVSAQVLFSQTTGELFTEKTFTAHHTFCEQQIRRRFEKGIESHLYKAKHQKDSIA